jgi:hypothetical protein
MVEKTGYTAGSGQETITVTGSGPAVSLEVSTWASPARIKAGSTGSIYVTVQSGVTPIEDATVTITIDGGTFTGTGSNTISGTTDKRGYFGEVWQTNVASSYTQETVHTFTATASKSGYSSGSGTGQLTVVPVHID